MHITVTGHQVDIPEPLRQYASEKAARIQKHFDHMPPTSVGLHVQKPRHIAEATIHAKGTQLHADAEGADMYAAIDALADKLDRQVLKHKEKLSSHHRAEGSQRKQNTH